MKTEGFMTVNGRPLKYIIDGNTLKGAHKGFIKIPVVAKAKLVEKIFLMDNDITNLAGIEAYTNLKVLSLESNKISKLNEIRILSKLPLQNVNLQLNPVTKLPFYEQFVVANIPTLLQFDSKRVDDKTRQKAKLTLEKEAEVLNQLCANELKIASLENLLQQAKQEDDVLSQSWLQNAKAVISAQNIQDFEITDEDKEEKFEIFREEAEKFKRDTGLKRKWFEIYRNIDEMQVQVINDLIRQIEEVISRSKEALVQHSHSRSISQSPRTPIQNRKSPMQSKISPILRTKDSMMSSLLSMSPMPRPPLQVNEEELEEETVKVPAFFLRMQANRMKRSCFKEWNKLSFSSVDSRILSSYTAGKDKAIKMKFFYKWHHLNQHEQINQQTNVQQQQQQPMRSPYKRPKKLVIQNTVSIRKPFKPSIANSPENAELLEESQRLACLVSKLQAQLEREKEETMETKRALEESVRRSIEKDRKFEQISNENAMLRKQIADEKKKYENEVFRLMMESRMNTDETREEHFKQIEEDNKRIASENEALKQYVKEMKFTSDAEIKDLKGKLAAAFEVAGGLRQKITKLTSQSQNETPRNASKEKELSSSPVYAGIN